MASDTYHEPYDLLPAPTTDRHRAVTSLIEELEAIDWYQQRADVCGDDELRAILVHNKNEEIEHAMMILEWLRRTTPDFDERLRTYVGTQGPITEAEERSKEGAAAGAGGAQGAGERRESGESAGGGLSFAPVGASGSLGIGSLKGA